MSTSTRGFWCPKCQTTPRGHFCCDEKCKRCDKGIALYFHACCRSCSAELESCYECGIPIQDGVTYTEDLNRAIAEHQKNIAHAQKRIAELISEDPKNEQLEWFEGDIKDYTEKRDRLIKFREKLPTMPRAEFLQHLTRYSLYSDE